MANELKHGSVGTQLTQAEWEAIGAHVFDSQATGDIAYASSSSQLSRLGIGEENSFLTVSSSGIPEWVTNLTVGDGDQEDIMVLFDGNAVDFHVGIDDSADDLIIGVGSSLGTTPAITVDGSTRNVTIATDLTISGDDLYMATNTSGYVLVADGTNYNPVAVSGDVTLASTGAITIANDAVESGMLNDNVISGQTELASGGIVAADEIAISDGGTLKKIGVDNLIIDSPALVSEAAIANGDYVLFLDGGATGSAKKEALADMATLFAGTGLTASSSVIGVDASQTQITSVGTIGTGVWQGTAIASGYIAADAITGAKIADDAIDSEHYTDGSIDAAHIASSAVTTAKINADAITAAKIADNAIGNEHIGDDAVDSDELAAGAVDFAHIQNVAANSILGRNANSSGVLSEVALATTQILIGDGTGFTAAALSGDATMTNAGVVSLEAAQTNITSIYATDLIIGEDSQTAIDFGTADEIDFKINNTTELTLDASALYPTNNAGLDLGTSTLEFKDAFFDGTVTSDAFAGPLTGNVTGNVSGTAATVTGGTQASITTVANVTEVGALDAGSISSNFGAIDNGTSGIRTNTFTVETSIVPSTSGGADIGSTSAEWGDVFIGDDKKIYLGDGQDVSLEYDENGTDQLRIVGNTVFENQIEATLDIEIDSTPSDNTVSGITATFTAGEDLERGEVVYFKQADSKMWKAVATAAATSRCVAMAAEDISADAAGLFLLQGFCTDNGTFPDYSASSGVGKAVYTPEAETSSQNVPEKTAPDTDGDFVQVIGYVVSANTLYFNPSNDIIEHD